MESARLLLATYYAQNFSTLKLENKRIIFLLRGRISVMIFLHKIIVTVTFIIVIKVFENCSLWKMTLRPLSKTLVSLFSSVISQNNW